MPRRTHISTVLATMLIALSLVAAYGSFSWIVILRDGVSNHTNTISGNVTTAGSMSANIHYGGSQIGTATGTFSGNAGSGTWTTIIPSSGTWSATR